MKRILIFILIIIAAILFAGCNPLIPVTLETSRVTIATGIDLSAVGSKAVPTGIASFRLTVTADGMTEVEKNFTTESLSIDLEAGMARTFTLNALDSSGNALYSGAATRDLTAGEAVSVVITMSKSGFYITFNTNGGTSVASVYAAADSLITAPVAPTKSNYYFAGWYSDSALTIPWNFAGSKVAADTTLYAKWAVQVFTVHFEPNGGSPSPGDQSHSAGSYVSEPEVPTRAGSRFAGWYKDAEYLTLWNFASDPVVESLTLYAKWNNYLILGNGYVTADGVCTTLGASTEITIECWINPADVTLDQYFIAFNGNDDSNRLQFGILTSGNLKYLDSTGINTGAAVTAGIWQHVALTVDSGNNIEVYFNGINIYTGTFSGTIFSSDGKFSIGQEWDPGAAAGNFYSGSIDDIRIWNIVRTQTEIADNLNTTLTGSEAGLIAYYGCTDTAGSVLADSTANGNDGVITRFSVGGTGPSGGYVFYDKGDYTDGWRYMEAYPLDIGSTAFAVNGNGIDVTATVSAIGTGLENTALIVTQRVIDTDTGTAAQICDSATGYGFSDWFLPSYDELTTMYNELYLNALGSLQPAIYWTSTDGPLDNDCARAFDFSSGSESLSYWHSNGAAVRPARRF